MKSHDSAFVIFVKTESHAEAQSSQSEDSIFLCELCASA